MYSPLSVLCAPVLWGEEGSMLCSHNTKLIMQSEGKQLRLPEHSGEEKEKTTSASNEGFITEESGFVLRVCVRACVYIFMCVL